MNAYILEINGRHAAALTEDGRFVRIKNKNYCVGQSIWLDGRNARANQQTRRTALASMAAGFLLLLGGFTSYAAPVGVANSPGALPTTMGMPSSSRAVAGAGTGKTP